MASRTVRAGLPFSEVDDGAPDNDVVLALSARSNLLEKLHTGEFVPCIFLDQEL